MKATAIYKHEDLVADGYFPYAGDYMIDDKKHFYVSDNITKESLEQVYI